MSAKEDYVNIGLMLLSCALAFALPFELFLFSYAIIGPLHYLTEISWLHQRNYFATGKKDYTVLIFLCLFISVGVVFHDIFIVRNYFNGTFHPDMLKVIMKTYSGWVPVAIFTAFVGSVGLIVFQKTSSKLILFLIGFIVGHLIRDTKIAIVLIGIFVPTLMHVYVFTGLFMLYGALKSNSKVGYISVIVFISCAVSFYLLQRLPVFFPVSFYAKNVVSTTGFGSVNMSAISVFKSGVINAFDVFDSRRGLMVQRFIAFAYTYHYLNWFSKTEIIKWHLVPKKWLFGSIVIWLVSVGLYVYNFRTGLIALFFLSLLHVFLEFPLNFRSIIGIWEELKTKIGSKKIPSSPLK